jgi:hypothetical protein
VLTCLSKQLFGVECPGCGIQRSALSFVRGNFIESLALFPALIPFVLFTVVGLLSLIKPLKINLKLVLFLAIFTFSMMVIHYVLKITGNAPWYDEAAAHFHP